MINPFNLDSPNAYPGWREQKLSNAITSADELIVEIKDPCRLTAAERDALQSRCRRSNMVIYKSQSTIDEQGLQKLGAQLGLQRLDANWLAGEQGISRITVCNTGTQPAYIPYTDRAIKWHTDGYYNPPERQIHAMVLHCAQSAGQGGKNRVMDHEIAYLMLRDANLDYIRALSAPDAMTIPERCDEQGVARAAQTGPVFSVNPHNGTLHMRYTARTRSIEWKQDDTTLAAVALLERLLATESPHIHQLKLQPGMGLLCNNVLHDRAAFTDDANSPRLVYRARYLERIAAQPSI